MDFKLSKKNKEGKWYTYGYISTNQWGNNQASFKLTSLKGLVALAESEGKEWVNLSLFENDKRPIAKKEPEQQFLNDEVPF